MWITRDDVAVSSHKALGFIGHKLRRLLFSIMWINHVAADQERAGFLKGWVK